MIEKWKKMKFDVKAFQLPTIGWKQWKCQEKHGTNKTKSGCLNPCNCIERNECIDFYFTK